MNCHHLYEFWLIHHILYFNSSVQVINVWLAFSPPVPPACLVPLERLEYQSHVDKLQKTHATGAKSFSNSSVSTTTNQFCST